ncbi:MAG TPA: deoxyribose-phosphate aldolase [Terriglobales bacterium]|nr:deoxyribose-phosphate aldolase [Terriglobales bacterium]
MSQTSLVTPPAQTTFKDWQSAARLIDHSLLRPDTTRQEIVKLCKEAQRYRFATVCVQQCWVAQAVSELNGSGIKVDVPIGFPQGAMLTTVKRFEAAEVLKLGAGEIDMVLNIGALKSGESKFVENDIRAVAERAHDGNAILKVILEMTLLTPDEKRLACELSLAAGADFVKTSTGLVGGATEEDVRLMRSVVGERAGIKASGGVRNAADMAKMVAAGATRIGTSSGVSIVRELGAPE